MNNKLNKCRSIVIRDSKLNNSISYYCEFDTVQITDPLVGYPDCYKDLYSNKQVFLDLVKEMVNAPWSKELSTEDLTLINKSYIASDYEEQESDIVYSANINDGEVIFYVLLEFQSTIDYRMPLRLFFYISEILREYAKNANHKKSDSVV